MKLHFSCPHCGKETKLNHEERIPACALVLRTYKCGHSEFINQIQLDSEKSEDFSSLSGTKEAYDYQREGIEFIQCTNFRCFIADAMGLGKTIQAILAARSAGKKILPAVIVVKSATIYQWCREIQEWYGNQDLTVCPIIGTLSPIIPGFDLYVISMDTLGRNGTWKRLLALAPKLVIVDECHSFKDPDSKRTKALLDLLKFGKIEHVILLSGTPIKNRANEYFVSLNILAPHIFATRTHFERAWLEPNEKGVYTRLKPWRIEEFKQLTSSFILRREKTEVLKNLPPFNRYKQFIEINDPIVKNSYNKQLGIVRSLLEAGSRIGTADLLGALAKLRHLTGLAKIARTLEYVEEFLENFDTDKIAIGIHHQGVRDALYLALREKGFRPLKLSGEDSAAQKDWIVQAFSRPENRVLVINTLAGGVGLNLQTCANTLVVERQWNAADEEQYESRFHRNGQERPVIADYLIAQGTIDQWFDELVEEKRKIFGETICANWTATSDMNFLRDLANKAVENPL